MGNNNSISEAKVECIITFIAFKLFWITFIYNLVFTVRFWWQPVLIRFLVMFLSACLLLLRVKIRIRPIFTETLSYIMIGVMILTGIFNFVFAFLDCVSDNQNPYTYTKTLVVRYSYPFMESVKHFPLFIPMNATNVRFFDCPQFLQGGNDLFLMYHTTEKEIDYYENKYKKAAKVTIYQSKVAFSKGVCDYEGPPIGEETVGYDELPDDFKIMILDCKPYKPKDWNHGYSYGLALSHERKEILFYQSIW